MDKIKIIQADVTNLSADAVVNAANNTLLGGGGVDGAIHRAAGPKLLEECKTLGGCKTGEAKITRGYNLPAKYVIHTVGPVWRGGKYGEGDLLKNCYINSLKLADQWGLKSISFPAISTGAYGYPKKNSAKIAISTVIENLKNSQIYEVIFVLYSDENFKIYRRVYNFISKTSLQPSPASFLAI